VIEPHATGSQRNPWLWVPSLYFAQGIPYVVVMTVAVIMFKRLGVGNKEIALYTSWLYLPYAIKPLWSPLVQRFGTRRGWVIIMQLLVGAGLACAALAIPADDFVRYTLAALAIVAVSSATHDVAADGYYLLALDSHQQSWFVGIRSTAYRMAMIVGQGLLVMLAGVLESATGLPTVGVQVIASGQTPQPIAVVAMEFPDTNESERQRIIVDGDPAKDPQVGLSLAGRDKAETDDIVKQVRTWNIDHEFYAASETAASTAAEKSGWLVSLEETIRRWFGPTNSATDAASNRAGDLAIVWMKMATPIAADEQQIVQFGLGSGDASFSVAEGERFIVTDDNWNQPFAAIVQVDPKLDQPSQAIFEVRSGNLVFAWSATFFFVAAFFLLLCAYHFFAMPKPATDRPQTTETNSNAVEGLLEPFVTFFQKPRILVTLAFLLLYRLPEAQLVKLATPLLLDARDVGGLALTTGEVGFAYGTIGVIMLTLGGIIGGFVAARDGLRRWLLPMALIIHLPNLAFLYLAYVQPEHLGLIATAVAIEQFGYGFGFTGYLLYCIYVARGEHQTVHYALCTGLMALGMMIPGMWSGWLEELIGYRHFFVWIMICAIPSIVVTLLVEVDPEFGKKATELTESEANG
jgi:PAT family beta-lactamase induction signal transducer AmpG